MRENNIDFDALAAVWDENPMRLQMIKTIGEAIRNCIPMDTSWNVLEIGCGTGTLALRLAPYAGRIRATDPSAGMISQLKQKLAACPVDNISAEQLDLLENENLGEAFDLVYSAMALHHVQDVRKLFTAVRDCLTPVGHLLLADLCEEDGSFHGADMHVPHNGFSADEIQGMLDDTGFVLQSLETIYTVEKRGSRFPVFLAHATPA